MIVVTTLADLMTPEACFINLCVVVVVGPLAMIGMVCL